MDDLEQKARQDLPELRCWAKRLLALVNETIQGVSFSPDDHFAFMALCFLGKQRNHMHSMLVLNQNRDVVLISRSMIEGLCQLLWAARDPNSLGLQWRAYSYVRDWRAMQEKTAAGERVDEETRARIETGLHLYGDMFLRPKARKRRDEGDPVLTDPYCKRWFKYTTRQICENVEGDLLYLHIYRPFSDYHHWDPAGFGTAVEYQQGRVMYTSASPEDIATALAVGFQCLLQTAEIVGEYVEPAIVPRVADLKTEFIAWYKGRRGT